MDEQQIVDQKLMLSYLIVHDYWLANEKRKRTGQPELDAQQVKDAETVMQFIEKYFMDRLA